MGVFLMTASDISTLKNISLYVKRCIFFGKVFCNNHGI